MTTNRVFIVPIVRRKGRAGKRLKEMLKVEANIARCFEVDVKPCIPFNAAHMRERFSGGQRITSVRTSSARCLGGAASSLPFVRYCQLALPLAVPGLAGREENFEPQTINSTPAKWCALPPDFSTALKGGAVRFPGSCKKTKIPLDGRRVLVFRKAQMTRVSISACIYEKTVARDVAVEVNYKAISGKVESGGGIVLRYSPRITTIARANALGGQH